MLRAHSRRLWYVCALVASVSLWTGCGGGSASSSPPTAILQSITITPSSLSLAKGLGQPLQATGHFSDMTSQNLTTAVTWASSNPAVATISTSGQLNTSGTGTATITATFRAAQGSASITVTPAVLTALAVNTVNASIPLGLSAQFTATATFSDSTTQDLTASVSWSSSNPAVATIGATGLLQTKAQGSTNISAQLSGVNSPAVAFQVAAAALTSLAIAPADPAIAKGLSQQFTASGSFTDGTSRDLTNSVTWSSTATSVATIQPSGLAQSLAVGQTSITAQAAGLSGTVQADTGLTVGSAALRALAISPSPGSVPLGSQLSFSATGTFTDNSTQDMTQSVSWDSTNVDIATVSNSGGQKGIATSAGIGSTTITAASGAINSGAAINVTPGGNVTVSIAPRWTSLTATQPQTFSASVQNTSNIKVTWSVDGVAGGNNAVGTIDGSGNYSPTSGSAGTHTVTATSQADPSKSASSTAYITSLAGVFTYKNDYQHTGQNLQEPALAAANLTTANFGKLFSCPVDGYVYAQPLYYAGLNVVGRGTRNVVFVATQNDTLYAFDADSPACQVLWQASFLGANEVPIPTTDIGSACIEVVPQIGILPTPLLDPANGTLYLVASIKNQADPLNPTYHHRLYAVDAGTGALRHAPVEIQATVPGTGVGSVGGQLAFSPLLHKTRTALIEAGGSIYFGFGSHCDKEPYHGWVFGYDANTLTQTSVTVLSPDKNVGGAGAGEGAGIWMSGSGLAVDSNQNIYFTTGDGTFNADTGGPDYGDSFVRAAPGSGTLNVADFFTPQDQATADTGNLDVGSAGTLILPDQPGLHPHLMVGAGKNSKLYLMDRDNMGQYDPTADHVLQSIPLANRNFSTPSYWNGNVYLGPRTDSVQQYKLQVDGSGMPALNLTSNTTFNVGFPGTTVAISSASPSASNAVVWFLDNSGFNTSVPAVLYAVDANSLSTVFYSSKLAPNNRDQAHLPVKFTVPTVANGRVYVGTQTHLDVYGLLP